MWTHYNDYTRVHVCGSKYNLITSLLDTLTLALSKVHLCVVIRSTTLFPLLVMVIAVNASDEYTVYGHMHTCTYAHTQFQLHYSGM